MKTDLRYEITKLINIKKTKNILFTKFQNIVLFLLYVQKYIIFNKNHISFLKNINFPLNIFIFPSKMYYKYIYIYIFWTENIKNYELSIARSYNIVGTLFYEIRMS